jgi:signal transduction histidine kinase
MGEMNDLTKTDKPGGTDFVEGQEDSDQEEDQVVAGKQVSKIPNTNTHDRLRLLLKMLKAVRSGDFSVRLPVEKDGIMVEISEVFNDVVSLNERLANEIVRTSKVIGEEGKLTERISLSGISGAWQTSTNSMNSMINNLAQPTIEVARVITAVAKGDLSEKMTLELEGRPVKGEFLRIGKTVNDMVDQLNAFASEVTRVAREVGIEGQLGGQAKVTGVAGTWKDLTDNVNMLAANLTDQVRNIAQVTTAVANGDLTQKIMELEQTRQEQLRMKDQLLSRVSSGLRTPLTAVYQFVTILRDGLAGDINPEQCEYLEIVLRNVNQLLRMASDILEVSQVETGTLVIRPQYVSSTELIMEIVRDFKLTATEAVSLSADIPSDLPPICADPDRVREIITNLLVNAIKSRPENVEVSVRAEVSNEDSNFLCVTVSDTGCGISSKESERIFEYMYQGESQNGANHQGLGLGLHICKDLVQRHGGRIWVESELGHGSTFFFTLPIFSVEQLLSPILTETNLQTGTIALITIEIFHDEKQGLTEADRAALQEAWNVIRGCILPSKDVLLPIMPYTGVGKVFHIVLCADERGAEASVRRIREHLERCEALQSSGLKLAISIHMPEMPLMEGKNPTKEAVKKLVSQIEELMKATTTKEGLRQPEKKSS